MNPTPSDISAVIEEAEAILMHDELVKRFTRGGIGELPALDRHSDAGPDTGWAHRLLVGHPAGSQTRERGGRMVMMTPSVTEEWPATVREWQYWATASQLRSDHRRAEARAERREFWREAKIEILAGLAAIASVTILVGLRMLVAA